MKNKIQLLLLVLGACCQTVNAQENATRERNVYNESVIVVGGYQPVLLDVFRKINESPTIFDTIQPTPTLNYRFNATQYNIKFVPETIKPAKIIGEPIPRLYRNYAKLGFGTYASPLAEFYFNTSRSKNKIVGVYLQHNSSWQSLQDMGRSSFSNTGIDIFGKYFWQKNMLNVDAFFTNNYYQYYGFRPDDLPFEVDPSKYVQHYNRFGFNFEHKSYNVGENAWQHTAKITFADMMDTYGSNQMDIIALGDLNKSFSLWKNEQQKLGLNAKLDLDRTLLDLDKHVDDIEFIGPGTPLPLPSYIDDNSTQGIFSLRPYLSFSLAKFVFDVAFKLELGFADETKAHFYPDIRVNHSFLDKILNIYAGWSGGLEKNSLNTLRLVNPYISNYYEKQFTSNSMNLFLGFVANPSKQFDINGKVAYKSFSNFALFCIDDWFPIQNVYKPIYDDADRVEVGLQIGYEYNEKFKITIGGNYYHTAMENEPEAWYTPDFDFNILLKYKIGEKFAAGLEGKFLGPMKGFDYDVAGDRIYHDLKGLYDISLSLDYFYSKSLRFFWLLNNLASERYYTWTHYPSQKFNTMIGLSYSF